MSRMRFGGVAPPSPTAPHSRRPPAARRPPPVVPATQRQPPVGGGCGGGDPFAKWGTSGMDGGGSHAIFAPQQRSGGDQSAAADTLRATRMWTTEWSSDHFCTSKNSRAEVAGVKVGRRQSPHERKRVNSAGDFVAQRPSDEAAAL